MKTISLITLTVIMLSSCSIKQSDYKLGHSVDTKIIRQKPEIIADGEKTFNRLKQQIPNGSDDRVNRVAKKLSETPPLNTLPLNFVVFQNSIPNSFALPAGNIGINSSLLNLTKTDDEIAAILSHEIAHLTRNHYQIIKERENASKLLKILKKSSDSEALLGVQSKIITDRPSRKQLEIEADQYGLYYMALAGYAPSAALSFWKRYTAFKNSNGYHSSKYLNSHPLDETRIQKISENLPFAQKVYNQSKK